MRIVRLSTILVALLVLSACASDLSLQKEQSEALRNLGEVYMRQENYTLALKELRKAEALFPMDYTLQNDLGIAFLAKKEPDLAVTHFKKALEIKPDFGSAKNNLATAYLEKKEWDAAIACSKELLSDNTYTWAHYPLTNMGWAYYHKKEYTVAAQQFAKALDYEPLYVKAMLGLGQTYTALGKTTEAAAVYSEALRTLTDAIKRAPNETGLYYSLARVYTLTRDYKKALNAYDKVVQYAPKSSLAREARKEAERLKYIR
jgi:type IV pilus assembly protein PilF